MRAPRPDCDVVDHGTVTEALRSNDGVSASQGRFVRIVTATEAHRRLAHVARCAAARHAWREAVAAAARGRGRGGGAGASTRSNAQARCLRRPSSLRELGTDACRAAERMRAHMPVLDYGRTRWSRNSPDPRQPGLDIQTSISTRTTPCTLSDELLVAARRGVRVAVVDSSRAQPSTTGRAGGCTPTSMRVTTRARRRASANRSTSGPRRAAGPRNQSCTKSCGSTIWWRPRGATTRTYSTGPRKLPRPRMLVAAPWWRWSRAARSRDGAPGPAGGG